ncbi:transposase [Streptomyces sp. DSM 118878]
MRWVVHRSAASCSPRACAGAVPGPGHARRTRTSSQKDKDHRHLHPSAHRCHGDLRRRVGASGPPDLPACTRLVTGRTPDQSGTRLQPRAGEETWVYGGLRPADGQAVTMTAPSRNSVFYQQFLHLIEDANPEGEIWIVTDNLSSHNSVSTRTWLEGHPRIHHAFIPVGACWLNLQEGWWRIFRKAALAGRSFANPDDIEYATTLATDRLNSRARPWIWGRLAPPTRPLRRRYVYTVRGTQH